MILMFGFGGDIDDVCEIFFIGDKVGVNDGDSDGSVG